MENHLSIWINTAISGALVGLVFWLLKKALTDLGARISRLEEAVQCAKLVRDKDAEAFITIDKHELRMKNAELVITAKFKEELAVIEKSLQLGLKNVEISIVTLKDVVEQKVN